MNDQLKLNFFADHCVTESVCKLLEDRGHSIIRLREILPTDTQDPIVAAVAERNEAILITHDGDFKHIAPRIPNGQKTRFRKLSRIQLRLKKPRSFERLEAALSLIEFEWVAAQKRNDKRLHIIIQTDLIKTHR